MRPVNIEDYARIKEDNIRLRTGHQKLIEQNNSIRHTLSQKNKILLNKYKANYTILQKEKNALEI